MKQKIEFNWLDSFNTGYIVVDGQHKKLFTLLSEFANAYLMGFDKEIVSTLLFELEDYTCEHFCDEEKVLKLKGSGPSEEHLQQHQEFKETLRDLKFDYVSENKEISSELFEYLWQWLQNHILGIDKVELGAS